MGHVRRLRKRSMRSVLCLRLRSVMTVGYIEGARTALYMGRSIAHEIEQKIKIMR